MTCVRFLPMRSAGEEDMVQEACTGWAQGRLSDPRAALRTAHMLRRPSTPGGAFILLEVSKMPCETLAQEAAVVSVPGLPALAAAAAAPRRQVLRRVALPTDGPHEGGA